MSKFPKTVYRKHRRGRQNIFHTGDPGINLTDELAGLAQVTFPDTTSPGGTYPQSGAAEATASHVYTFSAASDLSAAPAVAATDRATNVTVETFRLTRDAEPPEVWLTVPRRVYTNTIPVTWGATDTSGISHYDLDVRVEDGAWQRVLTNTQATAYLQTCQLADLPACQLAHFFTFRVTATDNVGNTASAEAQSSLARVTKYYYHGGRRVAQRRDGVVYYLHGDHLGSVSLATDAAGGFHSRQLFRPYGDTRWQEGTLPTDFGFAGQRHDATGLLFMHARYYDQSLGRFVSADTVAPDFANPQSLNRYAYARNNPVLCNDPDGHCPLCVVGIIALAVVVWGSMEMQVGEEAPPYDPAAMYWNGAETGLKWGGDTVGDAYALVDEWPENRLSNAGALALPLVSAGMVKTLRGLEYADEAADTIHATSRLDEAGDAIYVAADQLRFSQDSIRSTFKNGNSVQELIDNLRVGLVTADDVPPIRVFERNGKLYSLDNRRLYAFQEAGVPIRVVPATTEEVAAETWKFTTKNDGTSIRIRGR